MNLMQSGSKKLARACDAQRAVNTGTAAAAVVMVGNPLSDVLADSTREQFADEALKLAGRALEAVGLDPAKVTEVCLANATKQVAKLASASVGQKTLLLIAGTAGGAAVLEAGFEAVSAAIDLARGDTTPGVATVRVLKGAAVGAGVSTITILAVSCLGLAAGPAALAGAGIGLTLRSGLRFLGVVS